MFERVAQRQSVSLTPRRSQVQILARSQNFLDKFQKIMSGPNLLPGFKLINSKNLVNMRIMKKFYLETYGCRLNQADSEIIRGILLKKFQEAPEREADFVVINSCGVIQKTENKILRKIKDLKKLKKKIILAGCLPLINSQTREMVDGVIGPDNILQINNVVLKVLEGEKIAKISKRKINKARCFSLRDINKDSCVAIVPISEGCLGNCSYCATRQARGRLKSYKIQDILQEIQYFLDEGAKEIHLTSQDLGCFGLDRGKLELPDLLKEIVKINGEFKVRLGMANPLYIKNILRDLIPILKNEKIYKYLHIPVQSGSDKILRLMKRGYKAQDFKKIITILRKEIPEITIVTDIIVGFPQETGKDFQQSVELIKATKPNIINITKYSPRKNTEAAKLKDMPERIKTERSRFLYAISQNIKIEDQKKYLNKTFHHILVAQKGKDNTFVARLPNFKAVILKNGMIGEWTDIKITSYTENYLIGQKITL